MSQHAVESGPSLAEIFDRIANAKKAPSYDPEQAACYFMDVRDDFDSVKSALSALSGGFILLFAGRESRSEAAAAVSMALRTLHESREHLRGIRVPRGLERHHETLLDVTEELIALCSQAAGAELYGLREDQAHRMLKQVQAVYEKMKTVACMPAGLSMVSLESSCACGMHKKAGRAAH